MITFLSPAKKLLADFNAYSGHCTQPMFPLRTMELIALLRQKSVGEIMALMDLSESLAVLNVTRYEDFYLEDCPPAACYPALYYFQGDVYQSLKAQSWQPKTLDFAEQHLLILSGLYGLLRPLDLMQAYRLEMGTRLSNSQGNTLYDFWRNTITQTLNELLQQQKNPLLLNLASNEYSSAVLSESLTAPLVNVHFYEHKPEGLKMIALFAKRARGAMARFIMTNQIDDLNGVKDFSESGYQFQAQQSDDKTLVFVRRSDFVE